MREFKRFSVCSLILAVVFASVILFQNCSNVSDCKNSGASGSASVGSSSGPAPAQPGMPALPVLPALGADSGSGSGNGHGYDGKVFAQVDALCADRVRARILIQGANAVLNRENCEDIEPRLLEAGSYQIVEAAAPLLVYQGRVFSEERQEPDAPGNESAAPVIEPIQDSASKSLPVVVPPLACQSLYAELGEVFQIGVKRTGEIYQAEVTQRFGKTQRRSAPFEVKALATSGAVVFSGMDNTFEMSVFGDFTGTVFSGVLVLKSFPMGGTARTTANAVLSCTPVNY